MTMPREAGGAAESELAAMLAYAVADYEGARRSLEAAFRGYQDEGRPDAAAIVAMHLAEMHQSVFGNRSAAHGWLARAARLLEPLGDVVEHGYLELAIMACDRPDVEDLWAGAQRALEIARRHGDHDLTIRALADGGLALVCQGRLRDGFAMLDEALVSISAGDARRLETAPKSMCSLLSSCDRAADIRRAEEWIRLVEGPMSEAGVPTVLAEHCRMLRGGLLTAAGRWDEAERTLKELLDRMAAGSPHRIDTLAKLAEIRIHRGRLEDAAGLIAPYADAVAMRAPTARLHLAKGEHAVAVAVAQAGLRELVADRLRGAPLLDLLVQAELGRGVPGAAEAHAVQLAGLAVAADSTSLRADADMAAGRVAAATARHEEAVQRFGAAIVGFLDAARPLHAGAAHLERARSEIALGDDAAATVSARAALAVFDRLGVAPMIDQASQVLRSLGTRVRPRTDVVVAFESLTAREADVLDLVRQGLTNAEIGRRLFISPKTAEHHVGRVMAKLGAATRAEAAAMAATRMGDR